MKSAYHFALNNLPRPLLIRLSFVFRIFAPLLLKGNKVFCPVCERSFGSFLSYGSDRALRQNVLCPHCLSLERHRLLWLFLHKRTRFFSDKLRVLHIAPEQCFHKRFKSLKNIDYVTGDLESPLAEHHFDLHNIPFADQSFDAIICNHVLEHVADDRKCARELFRVLKSGGWAIMQVPIDYNRDTTFEDPDITSPAEREHHYWQKDHMRLFGLDYPKRLSESGFSVQIDDFVKTLNTALRDKYRLQKEELIYFLTRK